MATVWKSFNHFFLFTTPFVFCTVLTTAYLKSTRKPCNKTLSRLTLANSDLPLFRRLGDGVYELSHRLNFQAKHFAIPCSIRSHLVNYFFICNSQSFCMACVLWYLKFLCLSDDYYRASLLRQFCLSVSTDTFLLCVKKVKRITNTFRRLVAVSSTFYKNGYNYATYRNILSLTAVVLGRNV